MKLNTRGKDMTNEICADPDCGHLKEEHDIYGFRCHAHQGRCPCKKFIPCKDCMVLHSPENCPQNNGTKDTSVPQNSGITQESYRPKPQNHSPKLPPTEISKDTEPDSSSLLVKGSASGSESVETETIVNRNHSGSGDSLSDKRKIVNPDKPSTLIGGDGYLYGYYEEDVKEAVKKENALLSQLCAGVITWDEFHKERDKIFGSALV